MLILAAFLHTSLTASTLLPLDRKITRFFTNLLCLFEYILHTNTRRLLAQIPHGIPGWELGLYWDGWMDGYGRIKFVLRKFTFGVDDMLCAVLLC